MIDISGNSEFFGLIANSPNIIIADFYATWCKPCQRLFLILPNLEKDLDGIAQIAKIDVDAQVELKELYKVTSIPTFIFFKDGIEVTRFSGIKTLTEIKEIVQKNELTKFI
jgi:thioredoxin 1